MATSNTFPAPLGPTTSFTNVPAGTTTPNFTIDPGSYIISLEFQDAQDNMPGSTVTLVQVAAGFGNAANTTLMTMAQSGYYTFVAPPGVPTSYNFVANNGCKNVRITKVVLQVGSGG